MPSPTMEIGSRPTNPLALNATAPGVGEHATVGGQHSRNTRVPRR